MYNPTKKIYKTLKENIKLSIIGYDEPNNGRDLHIVKVEENGIDITKKLEPNWNRILFNLNKFEFCLSELNFCYFPFESGGIVYNFENSKILKLNYKTILPAYGKFIGNKFSKNQLIVVYDRLIHMINLNSMKIKNIEAKESERFEWFEFIDDDTIELSIFEVKKRGNMIDRIGNKKTLYNNV